MTHLISVFSLIIFCLSSLNLPQSAWAQGALDNPLPHTVQSGIGLINGWVCDADEVLIQIDESPPVLAAYGTTRGDTVGVCGDDDNGFGLTFNWNLVGDGLHRLRVTADGSEVVTVVFVVATLGLGEFPQGLAGEGRVEDFPLPRNTVEVEWQTSLQNFVLKEAAGTGAGGSGGEPPRVLENPQPGSFQSGIGLISGFVCEASTVSIQIDDFPATPAAYGTTRGDTVEVCQDEDNGFGLTFNWNIVGNGAHRVRAFADGEQFADVRVTVTTAGLGELPKLEGFPTAVGSVADFPQAGSSVSLQWQDSKQNFIVEGLIGQNARCDSPEGEAFDSGGARGLFRLLNLCSLDGGTARMDVEAPVQIAAQEGQAVVQAQTEGFEFCAADLMFMQGATELLPGDFRIVDGRGDEIVCREIGPGEKQTFTIGIMEDVAFTFGQPTQIFFNEAEVVEVEVVCGDETKNSSEFCDGNDLGAATCQSLGLGEGTLACSSSCLLDTSACTSIQCGNGTAEGNEVCDGSDLQGATCLSQGFAGGTLRCNTSCTGLDTSACTSMQCGNGTAEGSEVCDGSDLQGATCLSQGFAGGSLSCNTNCTLNTGSCFTNPILSVSPTSINLGMIPAGVEASGMHTITNVGGGTLIGTSTFEDGSLPFSLAAGQSLTETVTIGARSQPGTFSSSVIITSNGGDATVTYTYTIIAG